MSRQNEIKPTSRDYSFFYTYVRSYILHEPKKPIMELYVLICSVHNVDFTIKRFYQFQTQYHKWASIQEIDISKPHLFYQIQILSYTTSKIFKLIKHLMHFCKVKSYYASSQEGETNYAPIILFSARLQKFIFQVGSFNYDNTKMRYSTYFLPKLPNTTDPILDYDVSLIYISTLHQDNGALCRKIQYKYIQVRQHKLNNM